MVLLLIGNIPWLSVGLTLSVSIFMSNPDPAAMEMRFACPIAATMTTDMGHSRNQTNSEPPPVKDRLEVPISTQKTDTGLTPGLLRVMNNQLAALKTIPVTLIEEKWKDLSLPMERFQELCRIGNFVGTCEWRHFLAVAASDLCATLAETLKLICELLTSDPEGGPARISFETWLDFYRYLGKLDEISDAHINHVMTYLTFDM
ncbi:ropporin-1-like protein [Clonorchis sinensis]|uniref:Ropporin-1-like protein n=1 Tax=Clonorchis sinensis TaxID=79923 RepID=G7YS26_CLOSI|nr:ropporin-1-like protein [Clonorchis sinensis]